MRPEWAELEERLSRRAGSIRGSHAYRISNVSAVNRPLAPTDPNSSFLNHSARIDTSFTVPIYTDPARISFSTRPPQNSINVLNRPNQSVSISSQNVVPVKSSKLTAANRPKKSIFPVNGY